MISHFSRPELLARAIRTALAQGEVVAEVIVVDDGSPGGVPESLMNEYRDARVRFILEPQNRGAPYVRNVGIRAAEQPFIALLDCDDEWEPSKLEQQLDYMKEHALDICATRFDRIEPGGERISWPFPAYEGDPTRYILNLHGHMQTSTLLIRAEAAKALLFDEELKKFQDWDFIFRAQQRGLRIGLLDKALVLYRFDHGEQMTKRTNPEYAEWYVRSRRALFAEPVVQTFLIHRVATMYMERGDFVKAIQCAQRALSHYSEAVPHVPRFCGRFAFKVVEYQLGRLRALRKSA